MSLLRAFEPGFEQISVYDERRGVWLRVVLDAATMLPAWVELCGGREGDDYFVKLVVGDVMTAEQAKELATIATYVKNSVAAFTPPFCICAECGKEIPT